MNLPEDFCFADDSVVHAFAEDRASLMFGEGWKNRNDLEISRPHGGWVVLSEGRGDCGNILRVVKKIDGQHSHSVSCLKDGTMEDPATNVAGLVMFYPNGKIGYLSHHSNSHEINPADGTPSRIRYHNDGSIENGWYMTEDGRTAGVPATPREIEEKIARAKLVGASDLCGGSQEIVALMAGTQKEKRRGKDRDVWHNHQT